MFCHPQICASAAHQSDKRNTGKCNHVCRISDYKSHREQNKLIKLGMESGSWRIQEWRQENALDFLSLRLFSLTFSASKQTLKTWEGTLSVF